MAEKNTVFNSRPLFLIAICFGAGIVIEDAVNINTAFIFVFIFLGILAFGALFLFFKKWFIIGLIIISAGLGAFFYGLALSPVKQTIPVDESVSIAGVISETPEYVSDGKSKYVLRDISITTENGIKKLFGKVLLTAASGLEYGDVVYADKANLRYTYEERNPNGYNEQKYLLSDGIAFRGSTSKLVKTGEEKDFIKSIFIGANKSIAQIIDKTFDAEAAPVAKGLLIGDISDISQSVTDAFCVAGISHILSVSGLHIAFIGAVLMWLFGFLRINKKPSFLLEILILYLFVQIIGAPASAVRALAMITVYLIFNLTERRTDTLIVLSTAFLVVLIISPLSIFQMSFQLSFAAVYGIITIGDLISRCFKKKKILSLAATSIGASTGVSFFAAKFTGTVAVYSLLGNLLVVPLVSVVILLIVISVILGLIFAPFAFMTALLGSFLINAIINVATVISNLPYANMPFPSLDILIIVAILALMLIVSKYFLLRTKTKKIVGGALLTLLLLIIVFGYMIPYRGLYIAAIDVSQGSATYIRTPSNVSILIDGGNEYNEYLLDDYLKGRGGIDIGIITHDDSDHSYGIKALMKEDKIKTIYTNKYDAPKISIESNTNKILTLKKGGALYFDGVKITNYNPSPTSDSQDSNSNSLVLLVEYKGKRILIPGDIPSEVEEDIMNQLGDIDVLFVAHHGADASTSDEFLNCVKPETAIISVGKNNYGHPSDRVINSLSKVCDNIYSTQENGCIELYIDGKIKIETVR